MGIFRSDAEIAQSFRQRCTHRYQKVERDYGIASEMVVRKFRCGPPIRCCQICGSLDPNCVDEIYDHIEQLEDADFDASRRIKEISERELRLRDGAPLPDNELGKRIKNQRERIGRLEAELAALKERADTAEAAAEFAEARYGLYADERFAAVTANRNLSEQLRSLRDSFAEIERENFRLRGLLRTHGVDPVTALASSTETQ